MTAILDLFSADFSECNSIDSVRAFLDGQTSFARTNLVADGEGVYICMHAPIGTDCLRQVLEDALKVTPTAWEKYNRHRAQVSERHAIEYLQTIFGVSATHAQLKYFRPKQGVETSRLNAAAVGITAIADVAEADALFLIEDVAICVEVKARST